MLHAAGQVLVVLMVWSAGVVSGFSNGNYTDRRSLLEFKKAMSLDPQQALMSWNDSTHLCSWEGVLCSVKHPQRVASLNLTSRGLVGQLSPSLGNLTFLKFLSLSSNSFSGEIPPSLFHLHHLQYIELNNNMLQGSIPSLANCSKLTNLSLKNNQLDGEIPADLPNGFQNLILGNNNLTGRIPTSLANITTFELLNCRGNNIEGNIPNEFAKLSALRYLYVGINELSGHFPFALLNLSNLFELSLAFNNLIGDVPPNLGNSLPNLQLFELGGNFFHGHIPYSLTNASELYLIDISLNSFTGVVPSSVGTLSKLSWLNVEVNKLQARNKQDWEFMDSLVNCTELHVLSLVHNRLEGNVPNSVGNLSSQLQYLHLAENQLSGYCPTGIANLQNLITLDLSFNQFLGVIPECLGTLKSLQKLSLQTNFFTGVIPLSFSNLSQLVELYLGSNQLYDRIPPILGNLQMLEVLIIKNNNLQGSIPKELFTIPTLIRLSLSFNNLDGPLHIDIGNAKQLTYLNILSNNLSGEIPRTLGSCGNLEDIKLAYNTFSGSIPTSLGNMTGLQIVNLTHNNLTGSIPLSLGNLQNLEQLDLSFNNLKGEVPTTGIFSNLTKVHIEGNPGLCGGVMEMHLLACSAMTPNFSRKNNHSLKVVLSAVSGVSLGVIISILVFIWRQKQNEKLISLPSFGREFPKVSYSDLVKATGGFSASNLIGKGRCGSVFQGKLFQDENVVAIKVFSLEIGGTRKSFIAECNALRTLRHRNLVPILTACSSIDFAGNDFKALVYKFMPQGDLNKLLYPVQDSVGSSCLHYISLAQRLNIIVDVSDALAYLHHNHEATVVHCDIKPSNILLDADMVAHVGDFGLAKLRADSTLSSLDDSNSTSSAAVKGTVGYIAPECAQGQVSTVTDVYSFGVVLLEILIRRRPTDDMFKDGMSIAIFTQVNFPENILQIVDPQLQQELSLCMDTKMAINESGLSCLRSILHIGLGCTRLSPNERMNMLEVAAKLNGIRDAYLGMGN